MVSFPEELNKLLKPALFKLMEGTLGLQAQEPGGESGTFPLN